MIGFLVKKTFFDAWDHMLALVFLNFGSIVFFALLAFCASRGQSLPLLFLSGVLLLAFFAWTGAQAFLLKTIAASHSPRFSDVGNAIKSGWLPGIQYGISMASLVVIAGFVIPFYLSMRGIFGIFATSIVIWCLFMALLVFQYYLPVRTMLKGGYFEAVKKSFLICFDNARFSLFLFSWTLVLGVVSCVSAFMIPGIAGIQLAAVDALKLRLHKYEWLEANPDADRKRIPWASLLEEDRELLGKRSLRSMIFPWKE